MALIAGGGTVALRNVVIMCELVVLAVLTADFAREVAGRRAIVRVVLAVVAVAAVQGLIGLLVFYLGGSTPFEEPFSGYFKESDFYTRIDAGFYGPALLGSFCIFASAVISMPEGGISRRSQTWAQVALAMLVLSTLSRAVFAFALAIVIREAMIRGTERAHRFALAATAGTLAVIVALTVIPLSASPLRPESSREDTNPRLATLETSAEEFADSPLLGQGPGELTAEWQGDEFRAHLTPLNVAATIGIGGLAALTALVVILWRQRRRPANPAIWSGMAGLGVDALGQDAEHFRHVWIMFGLADADRRGVTDQPDLTARAATVTSKSGSL